MQVADEHVSSRRTRLSYLHPANNTNKQYANPYTQIVKLVQSFLTGRTTQLRFNGVTSTDINIEAGIPQGSPLSPILFMLYNAELLEIPRAPDLALGFIDDIAYGISGQTAQGNIERLQKILSKSEEWKVKHGAQFEPSKYMLVHFTRNTKHDTTAGI